MDAIPVGLDRAAEPVAQVRSPQQRELVALIVESPEFAFACSNPFVPEVGKYQGPFTFMWYDSDDNLHLDRIGKAGRFLRRVIVYEDEPEEGQEVRVQVLNSYPSDRPNLVMDAKLDRRQPNI